MLCYKESSCRLAGLKVLLCHPRQHRLEWLTYLTIGTTDIKFVGPEAGVPPGKANNFC